MKPRVGGEVPAIATLDPLLHYCNVKATNGPSYR